MVDLATYQDRWIECTGDEVRIHGYYFPWGTKHVPYTSIRKVRRLDMGLLTGRTRIWGTANPRYWASLDPKRPLKRVAYVLEIAKFVRPFVTPDDPDAFEAAIRAHTGLGITRDDGVGPLL